MVDVGGKDVTDRRAVAQALVRMKPETAALVEAGDAPKGDVVAVARIAGIQAAKRTAELVPLCHPLPLSFVDVAVAIDASAGLITLTAEARTSAQTGVGVGGVTPAPLGAPTGYGKGKGVGSGGGGSGGARPGKRGGGG